MKLNKISLSISTALLAGGLMMSSTVNAKGRLVVYCSATNILCETTTKAFGEKYDVKTSFIRNGSGSTFAKVEAEKIIRKPMFGSAVPLIHKHRRQN
ncbi:iron(III) transport system substrate-binding protein [Rodentibacter pneumotropicus]|uniref:Iron(III) transport system substrate-binding protein n=1 Tax=Rodentibacter pneumotropicus TaxID=758 RepID=A0A448MSA9_9PAST|nr:iron(III) transport system substrate-binding protein [Rodentibacter pneumotropicus]